MKHALHALLLVLVAVCVVALVPAAQEPAERDGEAAPWSPWHDALHALSPRDPLAYFEVAEEILDASQSAEAGDGEELRDLARQLFGLAGAIDPSGFGRSACLALADLAHDRSERERFQALANLLPGRDLLSIWSPRTTDEPVAPSDALALSEALGHYRQGRGNRALAVLQRHDTDRILDRFGHLLPGGPERFLEDCKHYTNGKKPTIFEGGIVRMLILESALLAGTERSWSGEVLLTAAQPLIEIDPDQLDQMLDADASRPYFVNGNFERMPADE